MIITSQTLSDSSVRLLINLRTRHIGNVIDKSKVILTFGLEFGICFNLKCINGLLVLEFLEMLKDFCKIGI